MGAMPQLAGVGVKKARDEPILKHLHNLLMSSFLASQKAPGDHILGDSVQLAKEQQDANLKEADTVEHLKAERKSTAATV